MQAIFQPWNGKKIQLSTPSQGKICNDQSIIMWLRQDYCKGEDDPALTSYESIIHLISIILTVKQITDGRSM